PAWPRWQSPARWRASADRRQRNLPFLLPPPLARVHRRAELTGFWPAPLARRAKRCARLDHSLDHTLDRLSCRCGGKRRRFWLAQPAFDLRALIGDRAAPSARRNLVAHILGHRLANLGSGGDALDEGPVVHQI